MRTDSSAERDLLRRRTGLSDEDIDIICSCEIFSEACRQDLDRILIESAVQEFPRNSVLFMQGDPALRLYVVLEGWVKVFRETQDGRETVIHVFGAGESFAEAAIFEADGYPASASACDDVRVLGIPANAFKIGLMDNRDLFERFIAAMNRKLMILTQQLEQLTARSATERLAGFLCDLCPGKAASTVIRLPLEKGVIAAMLGMQPETFSRSMSKLRPHGVQIDGDTVSIVDIDALRDFGAGIRPFGARQAVGNTRAKIFD